MFTFLIAGLGNPGIKYKNTRHNIGFRIIDEFAKENKFPKFRLSKKHNSLISESIIGNKKIILAKPQTFMNSSGKAINSILKSSNASRNVLVPLLVVHDDIDIQIGKIRVSENRGSAGHKGVQSIIDEIGTKNFARIRVGIKPVAGSQSIETEKFVLGKFSEQEEKILENIIKQASSRIAEKIKLIEN